MTIHKLTESQGYCIRLIAKGMMQGKKGGVWNRDVAYSTAMSLQVRGLVKVQHVYAFKNLPKWSAHLTDDGIHYAIQKGYLPTSYSSKVEVK